MKMAAKGKAKDQKRRVKNKKLVVKDLPPKDTKAVKGGARITGYR
jgi:hypothetical protein